LAKAKAGGVKSKKKDEVTEDGEKTTVKNSKKRKATDGKSFCPHSSHPNQNLLVLRTKRKST